MFHHTDVEYVHAHYDNLKIAEVLNFEKIVCDGQCFYRVLGLLLD